jgi:hypothetical protein
LKAADFITQLVLSLDHSPFKTIAGFILPAFNDWYKMVHAEITQRPKSDTAKNQICMST